MNELLKVELNNKLKSRGFQIGKELGRGTQGEVYEIIGTSEPTVIKFTDDAREIGAWVKIDGKKHQNIVDVFSFFTIKQSSFPQQFHQLWADEFKKFFQFVILMERLEKISSEQMKIVERVIHTGTPDIENYSNAMQFLDRARRILKDVRPDVIQEHEKLIVDVFNGLKFLDAQGIEYLDCLGKNVMKDPKTGNFKLIDLGYSRGVPVVNPGDLPEIKENKK